MIVAVTGGKGGVGKTTVAYNLAAALDAVVVDADLGMTDLPGGHGPDLHDVLAGRAAPVEAVREDGPVAMLPCGRSLAGARAANPAILADTIEAVAEAYGRVVIDCPAGLSSDVGLSLCVADGSLLVTAFEEPAVANAVRARALARELDAGLVRVVVNRVETTVPTDTLARELGAPVTMVPESGPLARAQRAGVPVREIAPDSDAAERFTTLADAVHSSLSA